ncbi:hypothetical protein [Pseudoalteromonas phenolica]|uniref:hypothetical protein n=1 Tax=Pseudoalteromonas phenolica TaxID=161398 RepID=UPI001485E8BF|nr:hypothetical protein [Pseudoalteromonas phenolica]
MLSTLIAQHLHVLKSIYYFLAVFTFERNEANTMPQDTEIAVESEYGCSVKAEIKK